MKFIIKPMKCALELVHLRLSNGKTMKVVVK